MVPPNGARTKRIPALSWDSVVDASGHGAVDLDRADLDRADLERADLEPADPVAAVDLDGPAIAFEPMQLDSPQQRAAALAPPPPPPPSAAPSAAPSPPTPVSTPLAHEIIEMAVVETTIVEEPVTVRTTPPVVIVPAIGDVTSGPDQLSPAAAPAAPPSAVEPVTDVLPPIQEATPVFESGGPMLPSVAPAVQRPAAVEAYEFDPAPFSPAPTRQPQRDGKQRGQRSGLKLVATLVVLGGLVAAGVVFGRPYVFPGEPDSATAPYADAVEAERGVAFAEPLAIVAESTGDFSMRLGSQLAPVSPDELAQWRALGLASGLVDDTTLADQLAGWQDALYSTVDGQVYHDLGVVGSVLEAQLVQEMTAASLDQEFGWSVEQPQRTLDAAAATSAEVLRQSRAVQQASAFDAEVPPVRSELVGTLPPVIGYRMLAPHVFAEFDASIEPSDRTNPLAELGSDGPGLLARDASIAATGPTLPDGDTATTPPIAKDQSFWYLVFAGYLDARTAYAASEAVVESAVTGAARGATQCASATFSGSGVEQTATLRSALDAWAAATPAEMSSSFQVLPDGTLQLVSCDPGVGVDVGARPDVARELLAWRMAELATMEAVRVGGGGETEFVDAWAFVQASPVAVDLMA
ncbi:MAG TPA: hypothetical protein VLN74_10830, partial [Ilumatobacteraceae bacterium]|nr:hypothetical protein [Ilumatobacteraceae bacterium]